MSDIIKIAMGELNTAFDNEVMKAVQKVGISVNKAELIKALELSDRLVRCQDCKYWVYNFNGCSRNPCTEPWYATDFCSYGERRE